jgi:hypothetical protein
MSSRRTQPATVRHVAWSCQQRAVTGGKPRHCVALRDEERAKEAEAKKAKKARDHRPRHVGSVPLRVRSDSRQLPRVFCRSAIRKHLTSRWIPIACSTAIGGGHHRVEAYRRAIEVQHGWRRQSGHYAQHAADFQVPPASPSRSGARRPDLVSNRCQKTTKLV